MTHDASTLQDAPSHAPSVIKLGGSLLDLPDLPDRFNRYRKFLASHEPRQMMQRLLLVVGGGSAANFVRHYNSLHQLGEHDGHWLAVRAMAFNAHCVARVLGNCEMVSGASDCPAVWAAGRTAVVEPVAWLQAMERQGLTIPHRWSFTSDSIAAAIAVQLQSARLTLLKSTLPALPVTASQAAEAGLVDEDFPCASAKVSHIEMVNLRANLRADLRTSRLVIQRVLCDERGDV